MTARGRPARRDAAEKPIVEALRKVGAEVWFISGQGLPDLLVRFQGRYYVGEVKTGKGQLTARQQAGFPVWRSFDDAWATISLRTEVR